VLAQLLADLLSRCSLIALMYQSAHSAEHSQAEHVAIVDAIERRDARAAAADGKPPGRMSSRTSNSTRGPVARSAAPIA
jgi:hypothetical protein